MRFLSDFVSVIVNNLKNRRAARSAVELAVAERGTVETGNFLAVSCEQAFEFKSCSFLSLYTLGGVVVLLMKFNFLHQN